MSNIIVCPLHDVEAIARVRQPSHILSLISPNAAPTSFAAIAPHHLELGFNDIAQGRAGLIAPSAQHIREILAFGEAARSGGLLLIHCWAGVSRSPAAAFIIASQRSAEGSEMSHAHRLRHLAPYATPNSLMIAVADQILGRSGAMIRAASSIGRGCDTAWGSAFMLRTH